MKYIFYTLIILCNFAIIFFGLKNTISTDFLSNEVSKLQTSFDKTSNELKESKNKLEEAERNFANLETLQEKVKIELKEKIDEASNLAVELAKEKQKRVQLERKLQQAEQTIQSLKREVDIEKEKSKNLEERLERMASRLETESSDKQTLLDRLNNSLKERDSLKGELEKITKQTPQYSLAEITVSEQKQYAGIILNINQNLNFCIISIGKKEGILPGIELVVYRESQLVGKIKVDRVFDKMSSANITSVNENEELKVEDRVRKF